MTMWKSIAIVSLLAAACGVEAGKQRLRNAHSGQDVATTDAATNVAVAWQAEPAPAVQLPEGLTLEDMDWFVDKEGRHLQASEKPLVELFAQTFVLQFTEAAMVVSGLANELNGPGPFTAILCWDNGWEQDEAFHGRMKLPYWRRHLREILLYGVHRGNYPEEQVSGPVQLLMMNGEYVQLTKDGVRTRVNGGRMIGKSPVSNGYVYLVQDFVRPSFMTRTMYQVITSDHTIFAELVSLAGMQGVLENMSLSASEVGTTVFAPTNTAFSRVSSGFATYLRGNANDRLAFVRYHIVQIVWPQMNMGRNRAITLNTLQGGTLQMMMNGSNVVTITASHSTSTVSTLDKLAYNGIVHAVQDCLLHKNFGTISTPTPLNPRTHITQNAPNSNTVFQNSQSYQSRARDWVANNCQDCGADGYRIMQRYALACIHYATNNQRNAMVGNIGNWINRSGWISSSQECDWFGIDCDGSGYVKSIVLRRNRLSGVFPSETTLLANTLEILDLTQNSMFNDGSAGNDWLGQLTKLKYLSVRETGFSYNGIPPALARLVQLTDLDISYCLYFGPLTDIFGNLKKLTYLDVSGNDYGVTTQGAPSSIGSIPTLLFFYAVDTDLRGNMNFITASTTIKEFWVDDNPLFRGSIPWNISNMVSLVSLSLADNDLTGSIPTTLGSLSQLKQVWLYGNRISGSVPTQLGNLRNLQYLELYDNSMNGAMPSAVCRLPSKVTLAADCTKTQCTLGSCCTCCHSSTQPCRPANDIA